MNNPPQGSNPPDPKASATLPPEILDKILDHIPTSEEGRPILAACALMATWWTGPSQRRLFSSVTIRERNYKQWMDGVMHSGSRAHLLGYVRSLSHSRGLDPETKYQMCELPRDSGEYLSALSDLRSLALHDICVEHISEEEFHTCFSAFRETLKYLSLDVFVTSFSAFVTLVNHFPNIISLQLGFSALNPDEGPVPALSRSLRGRVHVGCLSSAFSGLVRCPKFFNRFAELDLEYVYEELVIDASLLFFINTEFVESALKIHQ